VTPPAPKPTPSVTVKDITNKVTLTYKDEEPVTATCTTRVTY